MKTRQYMTIYYNIPYTRLRFSRVAEMLTSQKIRRFSTRFEDTWKNSIIILLLLLLLYCVRGGRFNKLRVRVLFAVMLQVNRTRAIYVKQQLVGKYAIFTVCVLLYVRRVWNFIVCMYDIQMCSSHCITRYNDVVLRLIFANITRVYASN